MKLEDAKQGQENWSVWLKNCFTPGEVERAKSGILLEPATPSCWPRNLRHGFFSLFSHEHNDPSLPSTLAPPTEVMRKAFSGKGRFLSPCPLLISLFREHVLSLVFLNSSLLRLFWLLINNSSPCISCQLSAVSKPICVQDYCCTLSNVCLYVSRVRMNY